MLLNYFTKERLIIDLMCALYFWMAAPFVKTMIGNAVYGWGSHTFGALILGGFVLLISFLEALAIAPIINAQLRLIENRTMKNQVNGILIFLFFLHAAISILSFIAAFELLGFDTEKNLWMMIIAIVFLFAKEVYMIANCYTKKPKIIFAPLVNQLIITLYSCLIFTIFLHAQNEPIGANHIAMTSINIIAVTIFFAFFYYPLRIPFLINTFIQPPSFSSRLMEIASYGMVLLPYISQNW